MITEKRQDIFETGALILVNPVNCVGVMGAGLAKQFKAKFPRVFLRYQEACTHKRLYPGRLLYELENSKIVCCFPTKVHWKENSRYEYVESGLKTLSQDLSGAKEKLEHLINLSHNSCISVAIPPLGCGLGGLERSKVKELVYKYLNNIDIQVYLVDT